VDDSHTPLQHVLFRRFGIIAALPVTMLVLLMAHFVLPRDDATPIASRG
jgi:hypothetical protein